MEYFRDHFGNPSSIHQFGSVPKRAQNRAREEVASLINADQEEIRNIFSKNDLIVAPVLNKKHKLIGRITADRIIEVAEEEAAEDSMVSDCEPAGDYSFMCGLKSSKMPRTHLKYELKVRTTFIK